MFDDHWLEGTLEDEDAKFDYVEKRRAYKRKWQKNCQWHQVELRAIKLACILVMPIITTYSSLNSQQQV